MTNTKLFKISAFSIFKNARFVFDAKPAETGPSPEKVEKAADIENTGYRLQKKFTDAVTKFKAQVDDIEKKSGTMTLRQQILAYKKLGDILGPVDREIYAFLQKHPEQKVLLVDTRGEELKGITTVEGGPRMSVPDWARAIGVGEQVRTLTDRINKKAQELLEIGTMAVADFIAEDANIFDEQISSAKNFDDLEKSFSAFQVAEKTFAEYKWSAQELQKFFGKDNLLGKDCDALIRQIDTIKTGTFARLNNAYKAGFDKILAEKTGPEKPEDVYRRELAKAKEEAEKPDKPVEQAEKGKRGWDSATGKFNLTAKEFQRDTLGKHFNDFALKVNGRVAARAYPEDAARDKNLKVGEYYYVEQSGKMTSNRALLAKDTVVSKDVPSDMATKILAKNSRGTKVDRTVDVGEPH